MPVFSHEVVPDHLRTKPDPEVEEQEKQLITDATRISSDVAQVGEEQLGAAPTFNPENRRRLPISLSRS